MENLKPCFACGGKVEMFKEEGEYVARCSTAGCGVFLDHLGGDKREAVRGYNRTADAPL